MSIAKAPKRWSPMGELFSRLAQRDLQRAVSQLRTMSDPSNILDAFRGMADEWLKNDPSSVLDWASGLTDSTLRTTARNSALSQWAQIDPEAARPHVESLTESLSTIPVFQDFARNLSKLDLSEGIEWVREHLPAGDLQTNLLHEILSDDAQDPEIALDTLKKIEITPDLQLGFKGLVSRWASHDLESALSWANSLDVEHRLQAIEAVQRERGKRDPISALNMATDDSPPEALPSLLEGVADAKPSLLLSFLAENDLSHSVPVDALVSRSLTALADTDSKRSAESLLESMSLLTESDSLKEVTRTVVKALTKDDLNGALQFTESLSSDVALSAAAEEMARHFINEDVSSALEWASLIPERRDRQHLLNNVFVNLPVSAAAEDAVSSAWFRDEDVQVVKRYFPKYEPNF